MQLDLYFVTTSRASGFDLSLDGCFTQGWLPLDDIHSALHTMLSSSFDNCNSAEEVWKFSDATVTYLNTYHFKSKPTKAQILEILNEYPEYFI